MGFFASRSARKKFTVIIIRTSKYDDEGYVIRYLKGVLPSNTLGVLAALAQQAFDQGRLGADVDTELVLLDDVVHDIKVDQLARRHLGPGRRAVVCFAGVQSNQFPRAADLAVRFKQAGFEAMIGGFHVSGSIAMSEGQTPPELQSLMDQGVTLVKGEVEEVFGDLLEDAWLGRLQPLYNFTQSPALDKAPIPLIDMRYQSKFLYPRMGTIDASRGCPYACSFCTIINVQGRKMRCRSPQVIAHQVEENYRKHKIDYYFFTDDNFARNLNRDAILDALIELREQKSIPITFMMQVDTKAWKIPHFLEKASRAGCTQVFLGIETLNESNLEEINKVQNNISEYKTMVEAWKDHGVACHGTLIIGFPHDTPASVAADIEKIKLIGLDQISIFMLTPLPGSADQAQWRRDGVWMDPDYNNYDSCHEALRLPNFAQGEWRKAWDDAWRSFYSFENMRDILLRCNSRTYWGIFKNFMWYRNAISEGFHPMVAGFWRIRPRVDRRPGYAVEGRLSHAWRVVREAAHTLRVWGGLFVEMEELWLQTRLRPNTEEYLSGLRGRLGDSASQLGESLSARKAELANRYQAGLDQLRQRGERLCEELTKPTSGDIGTVGKMLVWWNNIGKKRYIESRQTLNADWKRLAVWVRRGRIFRIAVASPHIVGNCLREARLSLTFFVYMMHELTCD